MKICGIYKITSPSKKVYIGQSVDIITRCNYYKGLLGLAHKGKKYIKNTKTHE
jgi:hypothetical protein